MGDEMTNNTMLSMAEWWLLKFEKHRQMSHTAIEYGQFAWNFLTGCYHQQQGICKVPNCWAKAMARRQGDKDFKPTLHLERLLAPLSRKKPARILTCFMGDLFGNSVDPNIGITECGGLELREVVFAVINQSPQHRFLFLSKSPKGYLKWHPFPDNCYIGFTACTKKQLDEGLEIMKQVRAKNKWISFEPLMESVC